MATVYEIKIKATSPWIRYDEESVKKKIKEVVSELTNSAEGKVFENIEVEVILKS